MGLLFRYLLSISLVGIILVYEEMTHLRLREHQDDDRIFFVRRRPHRKQQSFRRSSSPTPNEHNRVQFVFFMGLEGTGHHLVKELLPKTPSIQAILEDDDNELAADLKQLYLDLWDRDDLTQRGLLDAHCPGKEDVGIQNLVNYEASVVEKLQLIQRKVTRHLEHAGNKSSQRISIPLNTLFGGGLHGMMSYPNFNDECRKLAYPNLDLLYQACDKAGVDCAHVYIHRNPISILQSTLRREFHSNILEALQLYATMYQIVHSQLLSYPGKTLACVELLSSDKAAMQKDHLKLLKLFGLKDTSEGKGMFEEYYKAPTPQRPVHKVIPEEYQPYLDSMIRLSDLVSQVCHQQEKT